MANQYLFIRLHLPEMHFGRHTRTFASTCEKKMREKIPKRKWNKFILNFFSAANACDFWLKWLFFRFTVDFSFEKFRLTFQLTRKVSTCDALPKWWCAIFSDFYKIAFELLISVFIVRTHTHSHTCCSLNIFAKNENLTRALAHSTMHVPMLSSNNEFRVESTGSKTSNVINIDLTWLSCNKTSALRLLLTLFDSFCFSLHIFSSFKLSSVYCFAFFRSFVRIASVRSMPLLTLANVFSAQIVNFIHSCVWTITQRNISFRSRIEFVIVDFILFRRISTTIRWRFAVIRGETSSFLSLRFWQKWQNKAK